MEKNLVIIPTYKEIENIEKMIRKVFSLQTPFELLIVDDNSPDGTAQKVVELQKEFPDRLHLLQRTGKLGLGTAYITGFKWALEHSYDYIFEMDCDFSHNPDDLERLYLACAIGRCRPGYWFSLYFRDKCGKLAIGTGAYVVRSLFICSFCNRDEYKRYNGRI